MMESPFRRPGLASFLPQEEVEVSPETVAKVKEAIVKALQRHFPAEAFRDKSVESRAVFQDAANRQLVTILTREGLSLPDGMAARIVRAVVNQIAGLGPLQEYLPPYRTDLEEFAMTPDGRVWLLLKGNPDWVEDGTFRCEPDEAVNAARRILELVGRTVNEMHPVEDGRIPRDRDFAAGARFNVALPPVASGRGYPSVNLRFWTEELPSLDDLLHWGTVNREVLDFLAFAVRSHSSIIVSGGTRTGKTTLLNVLCTFVPPAERIVTVEDTQELRIGPQYNWTAMEARPANIEGHGGISLGYLVTNALRQAPQWVIPGEIRTGEAALQALRLLSTGHWGMTTIHTESARATPGLVITLMQSAGYFSGNRLAAKQFFAGAVRLIVHLGFIPGTSRRVVTRICEVEPYLRKGDVFLRDLFRFDVQADTWNKLEEPQWIGRLAWDLEDAPEATSQDQVHPGEE